MATTLTAYAPIADFTRTGGQIAVTDPSGRRIGTVDVIRGFAHYTGARRTAHEGVTAVIRLGGGGDLAPLAEAVAAGLRSGRDDRA